MYLLIDTSIPKAISLALFDAGIIGRKKVEGENRELLEVIDTLFSEQKISSKDVRGIAVVVGAGSFTSTRIATTIANAFAYTQNIPVVAIGSDTASDYEKMEILFSQAESGKYISATYSAEPNIGKKKS